MRAGAPLSARSYSSASSPDCDENETESLSTPTGPNFTTRLSSANAPARRNCSVSQAAVISRAWHTPPAGGSPAFARASRAQQRTWRATAFSTHTTNLPWYDLFTAVNTSAATRRPVKTESFSSLTMRIIQARTRRSSSCRASPRRTYVQTQKLERRRNFYPDLHSMFQQRKKSARRIYECFTYLQGVSAAGPNAHSLSFVRARRARALNGCVPPPPRASAALRVSAPAPSWAARRRHRRARRRRSRRLACSSRRPSPSAC